jgi:hypothetical protein
MQKKYKIFPAIQALYYFVTAVWPFIHLESFLAVTGDKTDIWLVKTVSVLLLPYCLLLAYLTFNPKRNLIIVLSIMFCCFVLIGIDFYYHFTGVIKWTYLIDGVLQILFLLYWIYYIINSKE